MTEGGGGKLPPFLAKLVAGAAVEPVNAGDTGATILRRMLLHRCLDELF